MRTPQERLEQHVERIPFCGCWIWIGGFHPTSRYGRFNYLGKNVHPHRVSLLLFKGPSPSDKQYALHTCNVRECINPNHLYWGTNLDNMNDARKARHSKERRFRLSETDVVAIRHSSATAYELAKQYSVHFTTIYRIKRGDGYNYIGE